MKAWMIVRVLALGALAIGDGTTAELVLHVHVYNLANVPSRTLARALEETSRILAAAGVRTVWEPGEKDSQECRTIDVRGATVAASPRLDDRDFLVARIVRVEAISGVLGQALPSAQTGVHVTILYDRIETLALSVLPGVPKILGNALAHEIGHVLLGSGEHSQSGIMKGVWTRADYQHLAARSLEFQPEEAAVLREEVSRRLYGVRR